MQTLEISKYTVKDYSNTIPEDVKNLIVKKHYKKSARSMMQRHVYGLYQDTTLVGAAIFGLPCGATVTKVHGNVLELRRFILVDEAPKNSESFFLGHCLRQIKKTRQYDGVITFADPAKEHTGVIYKATNFQYLGTEKYRQQVLRIKGRRKPVSMREVYQRNQVTKKYTNAAKGYQKLKKQGKAWAVLTQAKHVYKYILKDRT